MSGSGINTASLTEFTRMLNRLRLPDLKRVMQNTSMSRYGRKAELVERCITFITNNPGNRTFQNSIREEYNRKVLQSRASRAAEQAQPILLPMNAGIPEEQDFVPLPRLHPRPNHYGAQRTPQTIMNTAVNSDPRQAIPTPIPVSIQPTQPSTSHIRPNPYHIQLMDGIALYQPRNQSPRESPPADPGSDADVPLKPDVVMTVLPFYDVFEYLLKPTTLVPSGKQRFQENTFHFTLSPQQLNDIRYDSSRNLPRMEIQMRFCELATENAQKDAFPDQCMVKLNSRTIPLPGFIPQPPNSSEQPKRLSRPVDLTPLVVKTDKRPQRIQVQWAYSENKNFCLAVIFVRHVNSGMLLERLKAKPPIPEHKTKNMVQAKMDDDCEDLAMTTFRVSLLCPLVKVRMSLPAKPYLCDHVQCFDALSYLIMNEKRPTWVCPVCNKPANYGDLAIDSYLTKVLSETDSNTPEIEVLKDGSWAALREQVEYESDEDDLASAAAVEKANKKEEPILVDLDESVVVIESLAALQKKQAPKPHQPAPEPSSAGTSRSSTPKPRPPPSADVEIIELSDSDDEAPPPPAPKSSAATVLPSGVIAGIHAKSASARGEGDVIIATETGPTSKSKLAGAPQPLPSSPSILSDSTSKDKEPSGPSTPRAAPTIPEQPDSPEIVNLDDSPPPPVQVDTPTVIATPEKREPEPVDVPPAAKAHPVPEKETVTSHVPPQQPAPVVPATQTPATPKNEPLPQPPEPTVKRIRLLPGNHNAPAATAKKPTARRSEFELEIDSAIRSLADGTGQVPEQERRGTPSCPSLLVPTPRENTIKSVYNHVPKTTENAQKESESEQDQQPEHVETAQGPRIDSTEEMRRLEAIQRGDLPERRQQPKPTTGTAQPTAASVVAAPPTAVSVVVAPSPIIPSSMPRPVVTTAPPVPVVQSPPCTPPRPTPSQAQSNEQRSPISSISRVSAVPAPMAQAADPSYPDPSVVPRTAWNGPRSGYNQSHPSNRGSAGLSSASLGSSTATGRGTSSASLASSGRYSPSSFLGAGARTTSALSPPQKTSTSNVSIDPVTKRITVTPKESSPPVPKRDRFSDKPPVNSFLPPLPPDVPQQKKEQRSRFSDKPPAPSSKDSYSTTTSSTSSSRFSDKPAAAVSRMSKEVDYYSKYHWSKKETSTGASSSAHDRPIVSPLSRDKRDGSSSSKPESGQSRYTGWTGSRSYGASTKSKTPQINSVSKGTGLSRSVLGFDPAEVTRMIKNPNRKRLPTQEAMDEVLAASEHTLASRETGFQFTDQSPAMKRAENREWLEMDYPSAKRGRGKLGDGYSGYNYM